MLNTAGVPSGPVCSMDEVFAIPRCTRLDMRAEVEHPAIGTFRILDRPG